MKPALPEPLADAVVRLEPLTLDHVEALVRAATVGREAYAFARVPDTTAKMRALVESQLDEQARGVSIPFATREAASGRVVGSTRFMHIERWTWPEGSPETRPAGCADAVEIGSTWLAADAQRTGINTHAKLLMLTQAFDAWRVRRVTLKTDSRNARSRAAIERLGARLDGVLRAHMPGFDGALRDTAFYSIVEAEWPRVREGLARRVG